MNRHGLSGILLALHRLDRGRFNELPWLAFIPRAASINLAVVTLPRRIVEDLIDEALCRSNFADDERRLSHAFQSKRKHAHMRDFTGHQKLQRILCASVIAEIYQALIDDLCTSFGRDVAPEV